jgi:hypothetical protein
MRVESLFRDDYQALAGPLTPKGRPATVLGDPVTIAGAFLPRARSG